MTSATPPDILRTGSTPEERALLSAQLGVVVPVDDAPALLDPRGARFQRLEWLGDSLLDVLVARVRASDPDGPGHAAYTSDEVLGRTVGSSGLPARLDWQPSSGRLADLAEAAIAVGHRAAGFFGARTVAVRLVSEALAEPRLPKALTAAQAAEAGSHVMEAAAALLLFTRHADEDEGQLSQRRGRLLDSDRIARGAPGQGTVEERVDRIQAELGRILVIRGEQAAVHAALPHLRDGLTAQPG